MIRRLTGALTLALLILVGYCGCALQHTAPATAIVAPPIGDPPAHDYWIPGNEDPSSTVCVALFVIPTDGLNYQCLTVEQLRLLVTHLSKAN